MNFIKNKALVRLSKYKQYNSRSSNRSLHDLVIEFNRDPRIGQELQQLLQQQLLQLKKLSLQHLLV